MATNDGGPAFPHPSLWGAAAEGKYKIKEIMYGMSLRDWFAGQALAGYIAWSPQTRHGQGDPSDLAEFAYSVADAMIAERGR